MVRAITVIYREKERRNFITLNLLTTALTFGAILLVVLALVLMLVMPTLLTLFPIAGWQEQLTRIGAWAVFVTAVVASLGVIYRYSPPRRPAKWRWLSAGSLVATLLWILGSTAFSAVRRYLWGLWRGLWRLLHIDRAAALVSGVQLCDPARRLAECRGGIPDLV